MVPGSNVITLLCYWDGFHTENVNLVLCSFPNHKQTYCILFQKFIILNKCTEKNVQWYSA